MTTITLLSILCTAPADDLVGLWSVIRPIEGRDPIESVEADFRTQPPMLYVSGEHLNLTPEGPSRWSSALPDGRATVTLVREAGTLRGYWVQPAQPNAQGQSTPIRFSLAATDRWRANVRPYLPALPLTIRISRNKDGSLAALGRETERNGGLFLGLTTVAARGDKVVFQTRRSGELVATRLGSDRILFPAGNMHVVLARVPQNREFQPRYASSRAKEPFPDAYWPTAPLSEAGFSPDPIHELVRELGGGKATSIVDPMVHTLLVARKGKLVVEEYFFGHGPERVHDTRSAGKSLSSMLFGALAHRLNRDPEQLAAQPLCTLVPEFEQACAKDPRKRRITVGHLMSMSSGLDCDDDNSDNPGNEDRMQSQDEEPNWYRYAANLAMVREPGEKGVYCSSGINLTGAALKALGGRNVTELFDRMLAQPLGIDHYHHNIAPNGDGYFGGGFRFRARDLLKLGELMRRDGLWGQRRLLPAGWAGTSFETRASLNKEDDYGYGWWRTPYEINGRKVVAAHASGNGGQLLFVVPELETVILIHGGNYMNFGTWRRFIEDVAPRILGAITER